MGKFASFASSIELIHIVNISLILALVCVIGMLIASFKPGSSIDSSVQSVYLSLLRLAFALAVIDFLLGQYSSSAAAVKAFVNALLVFKLFGYVMLGLAALSFIAVLFINCFSSYGPISTAVMKQVFFHGIITTLESYGLLWLVVGSIA